VVRTKRVPDERELHLPGDVWVFVIIDDDNASEVDISAVVGKSIHERGNEFSCGRVDADAGGPGGPEHHRDHSVLANL
jgi:hypothetical protein